MASWVCVSGFVPSWLSVSVFGVPCGHEILREREGQQCLGRPRSKQT